MSKKEQNIDDFYPEGKEFADEPTTPTLPRPKVENQVEIDTTNAIAVKDYHLTFEVFGLWLKRFRDDTSVTADQFWTEAARIYHKLNRAVGYKTTSIEEFTTFFRKLNPDGVDYADSESEHERHHGKVIQKFAADRGLVIEEEYGIYNLRFRRGGISHAPFMGIRNIETVLTTRELIIAHYDAVTADNPNPSAGDCQITDQDPINKRVTSQPTAPTLPRPMVGNR